MTDDQKRRIANELLKLPGFPSRPDLADVPEEIKNTLVHLAEKQNELMIDLHAKHLTEDQLRSQLVFYQSEIGKSILDAKTKIQEEFQRQLPAIMAELNDPEPDPDNLKPGQVILSSGALKRTKK